MKYLSILFLLAFWLCALSLSAFSQSMSLSFLTNPNFERSIQGEAPYAWQMSREQTRSGFELISNSKYRSEGDFSLEINTKGVPENVPDTLLNAACYQRIDALDYAGATLKLSAKIMIIPDTASKSSSNAYIYVRMRSSIMSEPIFYSTLDEQTKPGEWTLREIVFTVPDTISDITVGMFISGRGTALMDELDLDIIKGDAINTSPQGPSEVAIDRLNAFAKIVGIQMFYNPLYFQQPYDWMRLHLYAAYDAYKTDGNLAEWLKRLFNFEQHETKLIHSNEKFSYKELNPSRNLIQDSGAIYRHVEGLFTYRTDDIAKASLNNTMLSNRESDGVVFKALNVKDYAGKRIRFSAMAKLETPAGGSKCELWLNLKREDRMELLSILSEDKAVSKKWTRLEIDTTLPYEAYILTIGMVLYDDGESYFDDLALEVFDGNAWQPLKIDNTNFEEDLIGRFPSGWTTSPSVPAAGYRIDVTDDYAYSGKQSLKMYTIDKIAKPEIFKYTTYEINDTLSLAFPQSFSPDKFQVHSFADEIYDFESKPRDFMINAEDLYSRISLFIYTWNMVRHYLPSRNEYDFDSLFKQHLPQIAEAANQKEFLLKMSAFLREFDNGDIHFASEWHKDNYVPPFNISKIRDRFFIMDVLPQIVDHATGEEIQSVEGIPADQFFSEIASNMVAFNPERKIKKAMEFFRYGKKGTKIKMTIATKDGKIEKTEFTRDFKDWQIMPPFLAPMSLLQDSIVYINTAHINTQTFSELREQISVSNHFIIDLRGNTKLSEHLLSMFTQDDIEPAIMQYDVLAMPLDKLKSTKKIEVKITGRREGRKHVMFLIDETTTGYSAYIAYLAKEYDLGLLFGRDSEYSSMSETATVDLFGTYYLTMPITKGFTPKGELFTDGKVSPDIVVPASENNLGNYLFLVEKALDYINSNPSFSAE